MNALADPEPSNLTRDTVSGLRWTYGATAVSTLAQLGYSALMGRLLTPADFGLVAAAGVFLRFGGYFAEMGVGSAVVQRPTLTRDEIRTSFTSAVLLGALFASSVALAAPLAARMFGAEVVAPIRWLSLSLLLNGLAVTARGLLRRALRFRQVALVDVASYLLGYLAVGAGFALAGAGVWSLVAAALGQSLVAAAAAYAFARHAVAPRFDRRELTGLYAFGGRISVISFAEFLAASLDTLVVGAASGVRALGQYNRALLLVNLPLDRAAFGMSDVLFPAFSRAAARAPQLRRAYLGATRVAAALLLPLGAGIAVAAPELVAVLLGGQWAVAGRLVPLVVVASVASVLALFPAVMCEAVAVLDAKLGLVVVHLAGLAGLLALARGRGLMALAGAVALAGVIRWILYLLLMRRVLGVRLGEHLAVYLPALAAGAATAVAVAAAGAGLRHLGVAAALVLSGQVTAGALALLGLLLAGPLVAARREIHHILDGAGLFEGAAGWRLRAERALR